MRMYNSESSLFSLHLTASAIKIDKIENKRGGLKRE